MRVRDMRIGQRLAIGFGIVIALLVLLAAISTNQIASLNKEVGAMVDERFPKTVAANQIKADVSEATRSMLSVLVMSDPDQIRKELANVEARSASATVAIASLSDNTHDASGKEILAEIAAIRAKFLPAQAAFVKLVNDGLKDDAMVKFMFSLRPQQVKYFVQIDRFIAYQDAVMAKAGAEAAAVSKRTQTLILILAGVAAAISIGIAVITTRGITGPLGYAVKVARRVAEGDLTSVIKVNSRDEMGQMLDALNHMNASLINIVGDVRLGTESISSASGQIASGNLDLSTRTEQQAESLGQTSGAMRALTDTVQQNADNSRQANQLAAKASEVAVRGGKVVSSVVVTMGSITDSSKKIVDIIAVIDGIAFQTNILALNAAVEAARAGEQGRGFAVVAAEVRSLAQRSAAAAKEIKTLIGDSVDKVREGSMLVEQAGATMQEVVASVRQVTDIMAEITAASQEQSTGIAEVKQTILEMDETTQQNAALVEEAAAAAASMQDQAANLARVVGIFKVDSVTQKAPIAAPVSTNRRPPALRKQIALSQRAKTVAKQEPELTAAEEC